MNFFYKNSIYPYEEEIILILRRLDKDNDGRLNFEEFSRAFSNNNINNNNNYSDISFSNNKNSPHKRSHSEYSNISNYSKINNNTYPFQPIRRQLSPMKIRFNY